ncbi:MAG TPA: hypothetical protein VF695_06585 [Sphingomonas sp.]|jgi:hypothetical protein
MGGRIGVAVGIGPGDRILHQGLGQKKQADVLAVRRECASVRFDDGEASWVLTADCHPVPRRPRPMF